MNKDTRVIDAAKVYKSTLVDDVAGELRTYQPVILDLNSVSTHQADIIFNKLEIAGFDVRMAPDNEKSRIEVNIKH